MATISSDFSEPVAAMSAMMNGIAAKNATMKDGPPESSGQGAGGGSTTTRPRTPPPTASERVKAYEDYKRKTAATYDKFRDSIKPDGSIDEAVETDFDLQRAQNLADLGLVIGPGVFGAALDLVKLFIPKK